MPAPQEQRARSAEADGAQAAKHVAGHDISCPYEGKGPTLKIQVFGTRKVERECRRLSPILKSTGRSACATCPKLRLFGCGQNPLDLLEVIDIVPGEHRHDGLQRLPPAYFVRSTDFPLLGSE